MAELPDIILLKEVNKGSSVSPISFHPALPILVNGSYSRKDLSVQFFDVPDLRKVGFINWNTDPTRFIRTVNCVAFHPRLGVMLTGDAGDNNNVKIFDIKNYNTDYETADQIISVDLATLSGHIGAITCVAFHSKLPYFATSSWDTTAKIWHYNKDNWTETRCVLTLQHTSEVTSIAFHPTQPKLASTSGNSSAKMWDFLVDSAAEATTNIPSITLKEHTNTSCVAFHPGPSNYILAVSGYQEIDRRRHYSIKLWNYRSKECIATLQGHTNEITSIRFHPSMPLLVSGSRDLKVKFWCIEPDVAKTSCCKTLDYITGSDDRPGFVASIEFGPNHQNGTDSLLATGTFSGMLRLYDIEILRPLLRGRNPFYLTPTKTDIHRLYSEIGRKAQTGVLHRFGRGNGRGGNNTKRNRHKLSRKRRRRTFRKKRKSHNRR